MTDLADREAVPEFPPGSPRRSRGIDLPLCIVAWIVTIAATALVVLMHNEPEGRGEQAETLSVGVFELQGKMIVGMVSLVPGAEGQVMPTTKDLEQGTFRTRLCGAVVIAEIGGAASAVEALDRLDALALAEEYEPTPEEQKAEAALRSMLADDAPATAEQRADARAALGWFGDLAAVRRPVQADRPAPPDREAVLAPAKRVAVYAIALIVGGSVALLAGVVLLVALLIGGAMGNVAWHFRIGAERSTLYMETFAVWFVLFFGLQIGVMVVSSGEPPGWAIVLAFFASLLALAWPVLRGKPWSQVRQEIGWTWSPIPLLQPIFGVAGYSLAMPVFAAGVVLTLVLIVLTGGAGALSGGGGDSLSSGDSPVHPILGAFPGTDWWRKLQIVLIACVAAPVVEETMFRGVLYRHLRELGPRSIRVVSVLVSAMVSALFFAIIHPQGFIAVPALGGLAVGFALIREWRNSLIPCMVAHAIQNGAVMGMLVLAFS